MFFANLLISLVYRPDSWIYRLAHGVWKNQIRILTRFFIRKRRLSPIIFKNLPMWVYRFFNRLQNFLRGLGSWSQWFSVKNYVKYFFQNWYMFSPATTQNWQRKIILLSWSLFIKIDSSHKHINTEHAFANFHNYFFWVT